MDSARLDEVERHRVELTGYCYRMLACGFEAEDAVQETFTRAWRRAERFNEDRGSLRTWLYAIATNVCLDMRRSPQRRALPVDLGPAAEPGSVFGPPLPAAAWVRPVPDERVLDPADALVGRESVRLALVAALQHLPPRQRAVLILRDVLCWRAEEVAGLLGTSVAGVTSALQRARAALPPVRPPAPVDPGLLARYCDAFERYDVTALVALLCEDATMSMPPFAWWLAGRDRIRTALAHGDGTCRDARAVPVAANGAPAFAHYAPGPDGHRAFALVVLDVVGDRVAGVGTHLDPALFALFGLPMSLPAPPRSTG